MTKWLQLSHSLRLQALEISMYDYSLYICSISTPFKKIEGFARGFLVRFSERVSAYEVNTTEQPDQSQMRIRKIVFPGTLRSLLEGIAECCEQRKGLPIFTKGMRFHAVPYGPRPCARVPSASKKRR